MVFTLGTELNILFPVVYQNVFIFLLDDLVFGHSYQTIWSGLVVYIIYAPVTFSGVSAGGVLEILVFTINYILWHICRLTTFMVLG